MVIFNYVSIQPAPVVKSLTVIIVNYIHELTALNKTVYYKILK
jgi:hypothetical protein